MKNLKPGRVEDEAVIASEEVQEEAVVKPARLESEAVIEEIEKEEKKRLTALKGMGDFAKKSLIVAGLVAGIVIVGAIYDAFYSASSMLHNAPLLGILYVAMILGLIGIVGAGIIKEIAGYRRIRRIDTLQEEASEILREKRGDKRAFAKKIIARYKTDADPEIVQKAEAFERELPTLMDDEVMTRLEEVLIAPMDSKAKAIIAKYANQTAVSTAISPVAVIDAILILSRSHAMIKEVAAVYNLRPNLMGEMALVKKVFVNLAFAGVSDIMLHHSHDILGASLLSKVSAHGAQGVANGILTARVGLGTLKACRPLPLTQKQDGFFKNIFKMIAKSLFNSKA